MDSISPIDWAICGCYLALVIGLGLFFSNKQKNNDDFFLGGRNMHWLPVGLSLFATTFSSNSFVGLPAEGAYRDYHQLLAIFFIPFVVIPIPASGSFRSIRAWDLSVSTSTSNGVSRVRSG